MAEKEMTMEERKAAYSKINAEREKELFAKAKEALQLVDLTKTDTRTFPTFNKVVLRSYLQNVFSYQS